MSFFPGPQSGGGGAAGPVTLSRVVDLFDRVKISQPQTLFDCAFLYDKEPLLFDELTATGGAATWQANKSCVDMAVTSSAGSRVVRQSKRYLPYQPGKMLEVLCTGILQTTITPGITSRIGLFDNHSDKTVDAGGDGVFFQHNGTTASVVLRSYISGSQVDLTINQANWNIDTMNGKGASGYTLDFTKRQIFAFQLQWLGVGDVVCAVDIDGQLWPVHIFQNPNQGDQYPYMRRAYLPVRYEIENVSAASGATLRQVCSCVTSYGGFNPRGKIFALRRATLVSLANANETHAMSFRLKAANNRKTLNPLQISAICTSGGYIIMRVYLYATLTNATWAQTFAGSTNAGFEADIGATAFDTTNAVCVAELGFSALTDQLVTAFENTLLAASNIAGTADIITITLQRLGNQTETVSVAAQLQEY